MVPKNFNDSGNWVGLRVPAVAWRGGVEAGGQSSCLESLRGERYKDSREFELHPKAALATMGGCSLPPSTKKGGPL